MKWNIKQCFPSQELSTESAPRVIADIKSARLESGPVVLCGDFNGEPNEKFYDIVSGIDDLASAYKVAVLVVDFQSVGAKYCWPCNKLILGLADPQICCCYHDLELRISYRVKQGSKILRLVRDLKNLLFALA